MSPAFPAERCRSWPRSSAPPEQAKESVQSGPFENHVGCRRSAPCYHQILAVIKRQDLVHRTREVGCARSVLVRTAERGARRDGRPNVLGVWIPGTSGLVSAQGGVSVMADVVR